MKSLYNVYAQLSESQKRAMVSNKINEVKVSKGEIDDTLTKRYIEVLSDLSFVIDSIQKGVGNRVRPMSEDAGAVLDELRETFGYDYVSDRTIELLMIADYEHKVDRFMEMMTELTQI